MRFTIFLFSAATFFLNGCATEKTAQQPRACCLAAKTNLPLLEIPTVSDAPILSTLGEWQDDSGKTLTLADLRGQTILLSMFYASCEGICVITKNDMKAVEASLSPEIRARTTFVLVSLAPDLDSPAVLKAYRQDQGLSSNWRLLRGSAQTTATLAARLGLAYGRDNAGVFRHSSLLSVIDSSGQLVLQQDGIHADLTETAKTISAAVEKPSLAVRGEKSF